MAAGAFLEGANLGTGPGNCNGNFTVFDDQADTPLSDGTAPFPGTYNPPATPFKIFRQMNVRTRGDWELEVRDGSVTPHAGTVHCVKLRIKYSPR